MTTAQEARAHEIWAAAQLAPGESILDGVDRITALLEQAQPEPEPVAYVARSRYGSVCHFGMRAAAVAWAGEGGEVGEIPLRHLGLVAPAAPAPALPLLTEFERMQIIGDEFPIALVEPIIIQKIDSVCRAIERKVRGEG